MPTIPPFQLTATWDSRHVQRVLAALEPRQWAFAISLGVNRTAQKVKTNEAAVLDRRLDRPTPYTRRSLQLQPGRKTNPTAHVWFKDRGYGGMKGTPAGDYLLPQVHGGTRPHKGLERAAQRERFLGPTDYLVPGSTAPLDAYGNVRRGVVTKVMSALRLFGEQGYTANASHTRRSRKKGNQTRYWFGQVRGQAAIWERLGQDHVRALYVVESRAPRYRARFPFFQVAENTVRAHFERQLVSAFDYALKTTR